MKLVQSEKQCINKLHRIMCSREDQEILINNEEVGVEHCMKESRFLPERKFSLSVGKFLISLLTARKLNKSINLN